MKQLFTAVIAIALCYALQAQAPNWDWVAGNGTIQLNAAYAAYTDADGNTYATGYFNTPTGTLIWGPDTLNALYDDYIFIVKYNASGQVVWAREAGGYLPAGYGITGDGNGNIFVCGMSPDAGGIFGKDTSKLINGTLNPETFVAKYDTNGNELWVRFGATRDDISTYAIATGLATDASGNCYVTGWYQCDSLVFGSVTLQSHAPNSEYYLGSNFFIVKYDPQGNLLWAKSAGGGGSDQSNAITTEANGNSYITGFTSSALMIFGTDTLVTHQGADNFGQGLWVAKFDINGNLAWIQIQDSTRPGVNPYSIKADGLGHLFTTGEMDEEMFVFAGDTLFPINQSELFGSGYLMKMDTGGKALWMQDLTFSCEALAINTDAAGNVYLTGYVYDTVTIGNTTLYPGGSYASNAFVAKFDAADNVLWATQSYGSWYNYSYGIGIDGSDNVYIAGSVEGEPYTFFGSDTLVNPYMAQKGSQSYIFVARLGNSVATGTENINQAVTVTAYPNPFNNVTHFVLSGINGPYDFALYDITGRIELYKSSLQTNRFDIERGILPDGVYLYRVIGGDSVVGWGKLVVE